MPKKLAAATILTVALVTGALAAPAWAKEVPAKKYAKTVCTTFTGILEAADDDETAYNALPADDPAAFQAEALALSEAFLASLEKAKTKLEKVTPKVKGGKKEAKLFVGYLDELADDLSEIIETFRDADPSSPGFIGDVTVFEVGFNNLLLVSSDPFAKVKSQKLIGAFDQKACEDHVTVF